MSTEQPSIKKFIKNFTKYSPSAVIPALIGFLTIPLLTKLFDPSQYGNYVLAMVVVSFLVSIIGSLWGSSAKRFYIVYKNNNLLNSFYDNIVVVSTLSIFLVLIVFFTLLQLNKDIINNNLYYLLLVGILFAAFSSFITILLNLLIAKEKASFYSFFTVFQSFGIFLGLVLIYKLRIGISGIIWGNLLLAIIILPIIYYVTFKGFYIGRKFSKELSLNLFKYGAPLVIGNLAALILSVSDRFILGYFKGSLEVGIYSASYSISEQSVLVLFSLFTSASYPLLLKTWENNGVKATQGHIKDLTRLYLLLCIPTVVGLSVLSKSVIEVLTSPAYYEGYIVIPLVMVGALMLSLQWWAQLSLLFNNKTNRIAIIVLTAGISNILLNFILDPIYGFVGAAVSTFISYFLLLLIMIKISNDVFSWKFPFESFFKIIIASAMMGLVLFFFNNIMLHSNLIILVICIILGIIVYLISLLLLGELKAEEINFIKSMIRFK
jgi:O-antigen/teichoic acid export membrane protein